MKNRLLVVAVFLFVSVLAVGCATDDATFEEQGGDNNAGDATGGDAGADSGGEEDAQDDGATPPEEICGNSLDDDQDGQIDEECGCTPGDTQACYGGKADNAGVGVCERGEQTCESNAGSDETFWGACQGWTAPRNEICDDRVDNDCDGQVDEECGDTACTGTETESCYDGPEGTEGVGLCEAGQRQCENGSWGACEGAVTPSEEVTTDGDDNDCDGEIDEGVYRARVISGGHWHACAIDANDQAFCWGHNQDEQLGDGTAQDKSQPTAVNTNITFDSIVAGYFFTCGLSNGEAFCWGNNDKGQLGTGDLNSRNTPTAVNTSHKFQVLAAGRSHTCGIAEGGDVYCWGANDNAQAGAGSTYTTQLTPRKIEGSVSFVDIAAGQLHTCGLANTGAIYCWGYGGHGQIGDGSKDPHRTVPTPIDGGRIYTSVTAGYRHNCGIADDGDTYCWGRNPSGQLGDGSTDDSAVPVQVNAAVDFVSVSAGFFHTCGLATDDRAYCWGQNNNGQLGDSTTTRRETPEPVDTTQKFTRFATMVDANCALTDQNEMYCWGQNGYGQLATSSGQALSPIPVQ